MRSTKRIHPYVSPDISKRLAAYCAARDITESAVVQAALQDYLDGDVRDNEIIIKRLDRVARSLVRLQRDGDVHAEAFATYVRLWAGYLPDVPAADHARVARLGSTRYKHFAQVVAAAFTQGDRLARDIVKEDSAADPAAIDAPAAQSAHR